MDELIKYLVSKIGYTLIAIIGLALPGNLLIFVWNRELYVSLDFFKMIILSFAIPSMLYICSLTLYILIAIANEEIKHNKEKRDIEVVFMASLALTYLAIIYLIVNRIVLKQKFSMCYFIKNCGTPFGILILLLVILDIVLIPILKKVKNLKKV
jgi:magnesium-transporting ATPase (P-type)|nr:MAG TPA: hypothetical protein [Caudoviricetes sp.]